MGGGGEEKTINFVQSFNPKSMVKSELIWGFDKSPFVSSCFPLHVMYWHGGAEIVWNT
jgi:hypothetical protein